MDLLSFPASLLSDDEDLVLDLRPHWLSLIVPVAQTIAILLGLGAGFLYAPYSWAPWAFAVILIAGLTAFLVWPAGLISTWASSHFVVTTDRIIRRSGLIAKQSVEISLERISDVRFSQTILERLLGAGDLTIESAAGPVTFQDVSDPEHVQKVIFERKEGNETRRKQAMERAGHLPFWQPGSVADELAKLHRLHRMSVLSDEEYGELKARLLHRVRSL